MFKLASLCLFNLIVNIVLGENYKLLSTFIVIRHGDRTTCNPIPNGPEENWMEHRKVGELTSMGMYQEYQLGLWLKGRYIDELHFINSVYKSNEVYVRATDVNRCIVSAQSLLLGMFDGTQESETNTYLPNHFNPVPIHTVPVEYDFLLRAYDNCPRFSQLVAKKWKEKSLVKVQRQNHDFLNKLSQMTGVEPPNINHFNAMFDELNVMYKQNISDRLKMKEITPEFMKKGQELMDIFFYNHYKGQKVGRLSGGPIVKDFIERMNKTIDSIKQNAEDKQHKFILYSAHDSTVLALLSALHYPHFIGQPPYASNVVVELLQSEINKDKFYVNISFNHVPFSIDKCEMPCEYETFVQLMNVSIPQNWSMECRAVTSDYDFTNPTSKLSLIIGFIFFIILIPAAFYLIGILFNQKAPRDYTYDALPVKSL